MHCYSEDGELKEVIYGRVDDFNLPEYDPVFDFAGPRMVKLMKEHSGAPLSAADPKWFASVKETRVLAVPHPLDTYDHNMEEEPLIEGGDVMIDGDHIYIGNSGMALQWHNVGS